MNLLETLQAHKGSLIRLKTQLYWHNGRGYDGTPGRICLILDASTSAATFADLAADTRSAETCSWSVGVYLLLDGQLQCIWITEKDVELL